jgi:hypothetical protein
MKLFQPEQTDPPKACTAANAQNQKQKKVKMQVRFGKKSIPEHARKIIDRGIYHPKT